MTFCAHFTLPGYAYDSLAANFTYNQQIDAFPTSVATSNDIDVGYFTLNDIDFGAGDTLFELLRRAIDHAELWTQLWLWENKGGKDLRTMNTRHL